MELHNQDLLVKLFKLSFLPKPKVIFIFLPKASDGDDTLANTRLPSLEKDSDEIVDNPVRQNSSLPEEESESEPLLVQEPTMIEIKKAKNQKTYSK